MGSFWTRLKERKMVQWIVGYAAVAFVMLELFDILSGTFGWQPVVLRVITVLVAFSMLAAIVIAWYHGERGHQRIKVSEVLILALIAASAAIVSWQVKVASAREAALNAAGTVAPGSAAPGLLVADRTGFDPRTADHGVVVLPFENFSGDPGQDYFADGMTDDVISHLGKVDGLRVISRTTAMHYRDTDKAIPDIAAELQVDHVLSGSTRLDGDRIHITAQLIDARTDAHLWSEVYDTTATNLFAVQADIARDIAYVLEVQLSEFATQQLQIAGSRTVDPEAVREFHLAGQARDNGDLDGALEHFLTAFDIDSTYTEAYDEAQLLAMSMNEMDMAGITVFGLGDVSGIAAPALTPQVPEVPPVSPPSATADAGEAPPPGEQDPRRRGEPDRGRRGSDRMGPTMFIIRSIAAADSGDVDAALEWARQAVSRQVNNTEARALFAGTIAALGRRDEALDELRKAEATDPRSSQLKTAIGSLLFAMEQHAAAIQSLEAAIAEDSGAVEPRVALGLTYADAGRTDEALVVLQEARQRAPERFEAQVLGATGYVLARAGRTDEAERVAEELERRIAAAEERPGAGGAVRDAATQLAIVELGLGDLEATFRLLERVPVGMMLFDPKLDHIFEPLKADERFQELRSQPPQRGGRGERGGGERGRVGRPDQGGGSSG